MNQKPLHLWLNNDNREIIDSLLIQDRFLNLNYYSLLQRFSSLSLQNSSKLHLSPEDTAAHCQRLLGEDTVNQNTRVKDVVRQAYRHIMADEEGNPDDTLKGYYEVLYNILIRPFAEEWQESIEARESAEYEELERQGAYFNELVKNM